MSLTVLRAESREGKSSTVKIESADRPGEISLNIEMFVEKRNGVRNVSNKKMAHVPSWLNF